MKRYVKKEWKLYLRAMLQFTLCKTAYLGSIYFLMAEFDSLVALDLGKCIFNAGMMLLAKYVWFYFQIYAQITEDKLVARFNTDIRNDLSRSLSRMSYKEYVSNELGTYQSWLVNDIAKMDELGFANLFEITHFCISIVLGSIALIMINPIMLALSLAFGGLTLLFSKVFDAKMKKHSKNVSSSMERYVAKAVECLSGLFLFRGFNKTESFLDRMNEESTIMEDTNYLFKRQRNKAYLLTSYVSALFGTLQSIGLVLLIFAKWIPMHVFMGGGNILSMVGDSINNITELRAPFVASKVYFEKVDAIINGVSVPEGTKQVSCTAAIEIKDLSFSYDTKTLFDNYSYKFDIGKKYAIVGPSGAGKSTLLKLLAGYIENYTGEICFDKVNSRDVAEDSRFENMTYISQDTFLLNDSIINNITLGDRYTDEEINRAIEKASLNEDIKQMEDGLETIVGENGNLLSGGQKQRVGLARAFLHNKNILLIDEGTSALDHRNAENVVNNLLSDAGLTVIFVSHTLSDEVLNRFDKVVAL